jgi:hypothetical protein
MKTTTLRELIKDNIDLAFSLKLFIFCDYEHDDILITTKEFLGKFTRSQGYYGPYEVNSISKGMIDIPLYLGD